MNKNIFYLCMVGLLFSGCASFRPMTHPDCSSTDAWPTNMAFVHLKNAGLVNNESIDFEKTITKGIVSERLTENLFKQVHLVIFTEKSGGELKVITVNTVSFDECSESSVEVFVIQKVLP